MAVLAPCFAWAGEGDPATATGGIAGWLWIAPTGALVGLAFAAWFFKQMKAAPEGNEVMREIAGHVHAGAQAYLRSQAKSVSVVVVALSSPQDDQGAGCGRRRNRGCLRPLFTAGASSYDLVSWD